MRKLAVLTMMTSCLGFLLLAGQAMAGPGLNWGTEVNAGQCPDGNLVINVTHKVTNDADSGVTGNYWAYDNYNKHIQVWETASGVFCAVIRYTGSFVTVATASPNGTDPSIAAGIRGTFQGGYRATLTGTLNPSPTYQTRGNIGAFDYGWNGDPTVPAPNPFSWTSAYFAPLNGFSYDWWGWTYRTGKNGTWVNSTVGNSGDITD